MKVLHFGTLDVRAGGPAMSCYLTLLGLRELGVDAQMAMYPLTEGGALRGQEVPIVACSAPLEQKFAYSRKLKSELAAIENVDIYHAQGIWQYPTYALVDVARRKKKPYIITPRGMLYPQDIAKSSKRFKQLSLRLRLLNDLNHAACVHVTCEEEMRHCRDLGVTAPIAIITNPVEIAEFPFKKQDEVFRVGYIGRLSPRKKVERLIYAFDQLKTILQNAELLIIGDGDEQYEQFLRLEVEKRGLNMVKFAGFLSGSEKDRMLASCSILVMPSDFENLGNVILEGLVRRIPCIATTGAPWEDLRSHHCGWWVAPSEDAITEAILQGYNTSREDLEQMGRNGRRLVAEKYSVEAIARQMKALYEGIISGK